MLRWIGCLVVLLLASAGCRAEKSPPSVARPTGNLTGEVRASGEPLADAHVCVRRELPTQDLVREDIEPICVRTNAAGQFGVTLGAGIYFVIASAEHHLPRGEQVVLGSEGSDALANFELLPGGREYLGRVVDIDRKPIAKATVVHTIQLGTRRHYAVAVETDQEGRYRMWSAREGIIHVTAPGYARLAIPERDGQQLVLVPESSISGTVYGLDGRPVANARVVAEAGGGIGQPVWGWPDHAVRSDSEGNFTLAQLVPKTHQVTAFSPDREFGSLRRYHVGLGQRREGVVVTLDRDLHRYRALIVDADTNEPVAGCMAEWKYGDELFGATTWVDERGQLDVGFDSDQLGLGSLGCPGYVASKPFPRIAPDSLEPVRVAVRKGVVLHGLVVAAGDPQLDFPVSLSPKDSELRDLMWPEEDTTGARGRVTITGLAPGTYDVAGGPQVVIEPRPQQQEAIIAVPSRGRIEVEVGAEHVGRWVAVRDCDEYRGDGPRPWSDRAQVEPNGLAVIERAPLGAYQVSLDEPGTASCGDDSIPLSVAADETTRVRLEVVGERATHPVRVRVISPSGEPVAGAVVSMGGANEPITPSEWTLSPSVHYLAITDAQGRARLPSYFGERFNVVAARPGQLGAQTVDNEAAMPELEIRLQPVE